MDPFETLVQTPQYSLTQDAKSVLLMSGLQELTEHHCFHCPPYRNIVKSFGAALCPTGSDKLDAIPFIPARLFKLLELRSIADSDIVRVLTSSATTSQVPSRIVLDRETSQRQTRALVSILTSFLGRTRLPMIVVDSPGTVKRQGDLSARGAGIVGLASFGRDHVYALDDQMRLDTTALDAFLDKHREDEVLLFGFTYIVWHYFHQVLKASGRSLGLTRGVLIHSGGWKRMAEEAVSNELFKQELYNTHGIARVHNFYGMVEQVGSIFVECERGFLHSPNTADIVVRNPQNWRPVEYGQSGVVQVLSVLPRSYPGHSLLTEDLGMIQGIDDCACGRRGAYFSIHGRVPLAELRGCSDTVATA